MRVISGTARGTNLYSLEGNVTRPTSDRAKEALFNILGYDILDSVFLDLFAGSGAISIEALSRGAKKAILCDKSKDAIKIINKNLEKTKLKNNAIIYNMEFKNALKLINEKIDYVFLDPPYKTNLVSETLKEILETNIIDKNSLIIIETDEKEKVKEQIQNLNIHIVDERKYGRIEFIFVKLKGFSI